MKKSKVLLIGWDAADWKIIGPLLAKGEMPALKRLIDNGVYGNMSTMDPPYSPMLWSSVATGKTPDKHGVLGFIELMPNLAGIRPVTVNSRKVKAIWNILHNKGYKSNVVGWWPSFPAEPVNGVVVTDKFQKVKKNPKAENPIIKGTIHPDNLVDSLKDLRLFPHEITEAHILPFIPRASEINQEKDFGLQTFAKIMAENVSIHAAATNLLRTTDWDFMAIYYDFIDHFCHAFMKFHPPKLNGVPQNLYDIYKDCVVGAYRFQDMMLDRVMDLVDDNTTIIVMSDHGYESGHRRILKMPKYPAAPSLEHRQFGIFVASGPNIKKNEKIFGLGLVDIAPTILHMFNLPIGRDMDGSVALDIFKDYNNPEYIDSWEDIAGDFGQNKNLNETDSLSDNETMEQLIELGYIDKPDEKLEVAILKTKCDLKHNLARVYIGKREYEKAQSILLELIEEKPPIDVVPYYMDLLSLNLKKNKFGQAEKYLKTLRKLDKKFKINTYFAESKILIGKGKVNQALKVLQEAKLNNPNSEVWYQIGKIYMQLEKYEEAKQALESSLEFEIDRAKTHQALAEALIRLKDYETAAEHALTSIELVKYYPDAHYTLGEALEKLGDLKNAEIAFNTAKKLQPNKSLRVDHALNNIKDQNENEKPKNKADFKYKKDQIVIVSGLPRSGTSLMMQMLNKGGLPVLSDTIRKADISNPKGYFEYQPVMSLHKDNSWLGEAKGKSLKVVAPLLKFLNPKYRYKVVFMDRNINEIVKSQQKMIGKNPDNLPLSLFESYNKLLTSVEYWKNKEPGVEMIYVNYKDIIDNPNESIQLIESFVGVELDKEQMLGCVDKSLYRNRS